MGRYPTPQLTSFSTSDTLFSRQGERSRRLRTDERKEERWESDRVRGTDMKEETE